MQIVGRTSRRIEATACLFVATLLATAMLTALILAPQEETMGDAQRIVYVHVAVAWFGLVGLAVAAAAGLMGLVRRNIAWDDWAQAAAEVGWLCATLTLVTGSLWAHEAWNTWWTWDPRLTTSLILWTIYAGYFLARAGIDDRRRRARVGAVLSIVGVLDVPLVVMATRWFRGMHPVSPEMEPAMHVALLATTLAFTALFVYLLVIRRRQIALTRRIEG
jgi:heme exporter protein C